MSAASDNKINATVPPTSHGGPGTCDPRWNAPWNFQLLKLDDTTAVIQHYRSASAYWHKAFLASQASFASLAVLVETMRLKLKTIEAKLLGGEIHGLREALSESLSNDQPSKPVHTRGAFSPSTPTAMSGVLTPVEPIWLN